jgi:hypothetical protein
VRDRFVAYLPWLRAPAPQPVEAAPPAAEVFTPPKVQTLEELTAGWKNLPAHAFPRQVTLNQSVHFTLAGGQSTLPPNSTVTAISAKDGQLMLTPTEGSNARAVVNWAATDLQAQLQRSYDQWVTQQTEAAHRKWQRKQLATAMPQPVVAPTADGRPAQAKDGTYPLLLASMAAGDVTDITPKSIKTWGAPKTQLIDGLPTWCVDVVYSTTVYCGPIDATAQARVRDGKVLAWVYPSGEPVP